MTPLSMSKQIISNTFNQIGKPALIINGGLFLLFAGGLIKNLMSSRTPYLPFFILPFFFAYMAYRGWGFIQMGKMIADDEAMNNYTPAPALAIFGRSREQIISKLHRNGLMTLIFGGAIFIFNSLGAIAMIHTSKLSMREGWFVLIPLYFGIHAYFGWRSVQLSKMIEADPTLFNTRGVRTTAEAIVTTGSMSSMPQPPAADSPQSIEPKAIGNEEDTSSNQ